MHELPAGQQLLPQHVSVTLGQHRKSGITGLGQHAVLHVPPLPRQKQNGGLATAAHWLPGPHCTLVLQDPHVPPVHTWSDGQSPFVVQLAAPARPAKIPDPTAPTTPP